VAVNEIMIHCSILIHNSFLDASLQCIGQCWYVGVDYEIFLFAPFFVLPMKLLKRSTNY